jgi:hypothetical protein
VRAARLAVILDCCCVLAFVIIGRARHDAAGGESLGGIASTAWPFLAGLFGGWLGTRAWRRPLAMVPAGLGAWLGAAGLGMALRVAAGQGTAAAFVLVAFAFLGLFLLGWRLVVRWLASGADRDRGGADVEAIGDAGDLGELIAGQDLD